MSSPPVGAGWVGGRGRRERVREREEGGGSYLKPCKMEDRAIYIVREVLFE